MKPLSLLWAAAALVPSVPAEQNRIYLASIAGIELAENEYVNDFAIATWDVDTLAICHLPPGWLVRAGRSATPDGVLEGEATHGVTFLDRARLGELRGLALIRVDGPVTWVADGNMPATFAGHVTIGRYGLDEGGRDVALTTADIHLAPATHCPDPRPR